MYLLNKYLKCSVWRLALRYDIYIYIYIYIYMSLGFKSLRDSSLWCDVDKVVCSLFQPSKPGSVVPPALGVIQAVSRIFFNTVVQYFLTRGPLIE